VNEKRRAWHSELTRYHWFVLVVCTLGWLFDCLDQQLFALARKPAVAELLGVAEAAPAVAEYSGYSTSILLIGWATGGIFFGIMGDRIGRARTMVWTILVYSVFTGLCGISQTVSDFIFYRFMTGLGVGGQFAVGVALVAEVMPDRARPRALGLLQAVATVGNISAAFIAMGFGQLEEAGILPHSAWRWMFAVGILPALLAIVVMRRLKEPDRWQKAKAESKATHHKTGSLAELFGDRRWRNRAIMGMLLASAGVIGLWGIGFFSIDLNRSVFRKIAQQKARDAGQAEQDRSFLRMLVSSPALLDEAKQSVKPRDLVSLDASNKDPQLVYAAALALRSAGKPVSAESVVGALDLPGEGRPAQSPGEHRRRAQYLKGRPELQPQASLSEHVARITARQKEIGGEVSRWGGMTSMLFNVGAFLGIYLFAVVTQRIGRRATFALFFLAAFFSTAIAFMYMNDAVDVFWMVPLMGFCQLSLFGGYAIYFPELFPTRLRSTGISFCYNTGRFAAALGPSALGLLTSVVFTEAKGYEEPMRYAGLAMCSVFLVGIVILLFAPETKDQPLPE